MSTLHPSPGRYNLHRLGWSAFEELCLTILREVLGQSCTRFSDGPDGGIDVWFRSVQKVALEDGPVVSTVVGQCKHSSIPGATLTASLVRSELDKVAKLEVGTPFAYFILTNRRVSGSVQQQIVRLFEKIPNVETCHVLGQDWIENTLDSHPKLVRLVPRLFGIGDISQIFAWGVEQQTVAVLEVLSDSMKTFVPTESFTRAQGVFESNGIVVLVGPPQSGKSSIAATICAGATVSSKGQVRAMMVENVDLFLSTWMPSDSNVVYWVDDVFGAINVDEEQVRKWERAFLKLMAARRKGVRIIFCTRDYILAEARRTMKPTTADWLHESSFVVDVATLSVQERERILYNHIKEGDIGREAKARLKPFLRAAARLPGFTPELARRLGSLAFAQKAPTMSTDVWIRQFFEEPVRYFSETVSGLSMVHRATLSLLTLSGNSMFHPLRATSQAEQVCSHFRVSMAEIGESLEILKGSFVKVVSRGADLVWQMHHPSMVEAISRNFAQHGSMLEFFVQTATSDVLYRDTTTRHNLASEHMVLIPKGLYSELIDRMVDDADSGGGWRIPYYLYFHGTDELLTAILQDQRAFRSILASHRMISHSSIPFTLAIRWSRLAIDDAETLRTAFVGAVQIALKSTGCFSFLDAAGFILDFGEELAPVLYEEADEGFPSVRVWMQYQLGYVTDHQEGERLRGRADSLAMDIESALGKLGYRSVDGFGTLTDALGECIEMLDELESTLDRGEVAETQGEDALSSSSPLQRDDSSMSLDVDLFSDVDE